jgi:transposase
VVPVVTRFDVHGGVCPACKRYHQGRHPLRTSDAVGAASNQIGPVALSLAAELKHRLGVPYRKVTDLFDTYFGLAVSHGTLVRAERRLAEKGAPTSGCCRRPCGPPTWPTATKPAGGWAG